VFFLDTTCTQAVSAMGPRMPGHQVSSPFGYSSAGNVLGTAGPGGEQPEELGLETEEEG
jgi:hypothetical protein